jgi:hypothetical protein
MSILFSNYQEGFGAELKCPSCKDNNLHQEKFEIWDGGEETKNNNHFVIGGEQTTIDTNFKGNPSTYRNGFIVTFTCEGCSAMPVLSFAQHKGKTLVDFYPNFDF